MKIIIVIMMILLISEISKGMAAIAEDMEAGMKDNDDIFAFLALEEITWKDADIFLLTRPMRENEKPETHTFTEMSNWGIFEGTVTIVEKEAE
jgi:hypothetical protein